MLREKDLKGHIRGDREGEQKTADGKEKDKGEKEKGKEKTDLQKDNQLKSAVDILKSWEVFKRIGKN
jgi:carboxyl-terminal processing protease